MTPPSASPASVLDAFLRACDRAPERPLLRCDGVTHDYATVAEAAARVGAAIAERGVAAGDRVALFLENSPGFVFAYLGAYFAGAVVVPINAAYRDVELRHVLADAGVRVCVSDTTHAPLVRELIAEGALPAMTTDAVVAPAELLARGARPLAPPPLRGQDLAAICYTSGTTGRAKGATLTHGGFVANATAVTTAWGWTAADRLLLALPLFHMHGLGVGLHGTLRVGAAIDLERRFDADATYQTLVHGEVTMFFGVPTMYGRLLQAAERAAATTGGAAALRRVRLFVSGSAPLPASVFEAFAQRFGQRILERYGMTETVMISGNPLDGERRPGSVGRPFDGVEVRVVDQQSRAPLAPSAVGEVEVRGPSVCRGYWHAPAATAAAFAADGWFRTGDLGTLGPDGYLTLAGRAHDLIISGGFNVYPAEVEEVLARHPGVAEVAVVGLPDADLGEAVVAAVVARDPALTAAAVVEFSRAHLAGFKKPRAVHFVASLPRNAMGKVQRHVLVGLLTAARDA